MSGRSPVCHLERKAELRTLFVSAKCHKMEILSSTFNLSVHRWVSLGHGPSPKPSSSLSKRIGMSDSGFIGRRLIGSNARRWPDAKF
jgi:hypothetical protein